MKCRYARVSAGGKSESLDARAWQLTKTGCTKAFDEVHVSGAKADRAQLRRLLDQFDAGGVPIVTRLDRLARSTRDLLNTLATVIAKKAGSRSPVDAWTDTTTSRSRFMLTALSAGSAALYVLVGLVFSVTWPLAALARPGTPNNVELVSPAPDTLRFYFTNTAAGDWLNDENVVFDFNLEQLSSVTAKFNDPNARQLDSRTLLNCQPADLPIPGSKQVESPTSCHDAMTWGSPAVIKSSPPGAPFGAAPDQNLAVWGNDLGPARYCARVRAREWNNGHPQEGLVSQDWSAWVCATVNALAALPGPRVAFTPARGTVPSTVTILETAYTPTPGVSLAVEKWDGKAWIPRPDIDQHWTPSRKSIATWETGIPAPSSITLLRYRVCLVASKERACSVPGQPAASLSQIPPGGQRLAVPLTKAP